MLLVSFPQCFFLQFVSTVEHFLFSWLQSFGISTNPLQPHQPFLSLVVPSWRSQAEVWCDMKASGARGSPWAPLQHLGPGSWGRGQAVHDHYTKNPSQLPLLGVENIQFWRYALFVLVHEVLRRKGFIMQPWCASGLARICGCFSLSWYRGPAMPCSV